MRVGPYSVDEKMTWDIHETELLGEVDKELLKENEATVGAFKSELQAFYTTIMPFATFVGFDSYSFGTDARRLSNIIILRDTSSKDIKSVRFIRKDNEFFDVDLTSEDRDRLLTSLGEDVKGDE